jgi:hypothetical protein
LKAVTAFVVVFGIASGAASSRATCDNSQPNQPSSARYVIGNGEVYDKESNLTWQRCSVGQNWKDGTGCVGVIKEVTWDEAMGQANGSWRVPSKDELTSLVSPSCKNPAIDDTAFPNMATDKLWYWTSTPIGVSHAWIVYFNDGAAYDGYRGHAATYSVRLVRSGQ